MACDKSYKDKDMKKDKPMKEMKKAPKKPTKKKGK
jgi:hypothetical protein